MNDFEKEIINLEIENEDKNIIEKIGKYPILFTSVHSMEQKKEDGTIKYSEPFTKSLAKYVSNITDTYYLIKTKDNGIDPNHIDNEEFKRKLLQMIEKYHIELVFDIHGASIEREFDVEFGTLNNLSADFSTINELKEAFNDNGINNITFNEPFKGGKITQYLYLNSNVEVIQLEINKKYRDYKNLENHKKVCDSLISFINQYISKIK